MNIWYQNNFARATENGMLWYILILLSSSVQIKNQDAARNIFYFHSKKKKNHRFVSMEENDLSKSVGVLGLIRLDFKACSQNVV